MITILRSVRFTIVFAILLGLIYPLVVVGVGRLVFPFQASGSLVRVGGQVVGSTLIAQPTPSRGLFWPRPSATSYAGDSGGTNYGPTSPKLVAEVRANLKAVGVSPGPAAASVPTDMVESSGSGVDPDITIADAMAQIPRIARARGVRESSLRALVAKDTIHPFLGLWGVPVVDVLTLNLALTHSK